MLGAQLDRPTNNTDKDEFDIWSGESIQDVILQSIAEFRIQLFGAGTSKVHDSLSAEITSSTLH